MPFVFATGYGEQAQLPPHHQNRIVVQKPYTLENIARAMAELLPAGVEAEAEVWSGIHFRNLFVHHE